MNRQQRHDRNDRHARERRRPGPGPGSRRALTLVEVLVTIGTITMLLGLLFPALGAYRTAGRKTGEMSAARQLMVAYVSYATDNRDAVLPGYRLGLRARDHRGAMLTGPTAARYPWRIAPYLEFSLDGLYVDSQRELLAELEQSDQDGFAYSVSLSPSLGLNATWVGGNEGELGFNGRYIDLFGRFYVTGFAEVRRPTELMVFTSARGEDPLVHGLGPVEGFYRTSSPRLTTVGGDRWADAFRPGDTPHEFGFVSPRYGGLAVAALADVHVSALDEFELRDMRHWANRATTPDYALEPLE